ncbi:MAG: MBL fold metallo-hydrolase [Clostridium sp.]|nr:MBL fold metallo-hydrolase [Clostridium sp.]MCM1398741.1 MBL fold metallo-hydrolase [Clostridium sp.]MCM1458627.1 MBL fold metallo-hydrolase [Bacteroides sp.]
MQMKTIASGSSGNCIYAGNDNTTLLVDVGISKKRIKEGLEEINLDLSDVDGILITHEHIDHVKALGVISRSCDIPIYATADTCSELCSMKALGEFNSELLVPILPDVSFCIGSITVEPHSIWHDAADPVCYSLTCDGKKISIATDLGDYDDYLIHALKNSDILLVEANHDIRMLQVGPYPYDVKQRILGKRGHLSNEAGGRLIRTLLNDHIKSIILGHLSEKNNYPELAYEAVKNELSGNEYADDVREFNLTVAGRNTPGSLVCL